ncbi:MAG: hypothetical protein AAFO89_07395 [Planctomycetota bacterium]
MADANALIDHRLVALNIRDPKRLAIIREAIATKQQLIVTYLGHERIIYPHRLWATAGGGVLLETYQSGGGSGWGAAGVGGFVVSPLGGCQGWATLDLSKISSVRVAGQGFVPRRDFNPDPKRKLGEVLIQVAP